MKIIIAGVGKVGSSLVRQLSDEGHELVLIDRLENVIEEATEKYDVMGLCGNCATQDVLIHAGVKEFDLLIAATGADEVNLLCCMVAHKLNPNIHTIARIRNPEYSDQMHQMREMFNLSLVVNPDRMAAREIERLLKYPGFLKRDTFAKGRVEIVELKIDAESPLHNQPLSKMESIVRCKVLVCVVLRNGKSIAPSGDFVLQAGDRIFVTAPINNLTVLLKSLGIVTRKNKKVFVCGGSRISYYLTSMLEREGFSVSLIEKDRESCIRFADAFPGINVINGDAGNQMLLESEGLSECDAMVTLTGEDELNIILSLYGRGNGVPQVITKISHFKDRHIINALPLGSTISPDELCCNVIVRYVRAMENQSGAAVAVHFIADRNAEAIEFCVDENTLFCNTPLKKIRTKDDVLICCITHRGKIEIPNGDSLFSVGDSVVIVSTAKRTIYQLNDIFY